jgi:amino acid transporter
VNTIVGSAIFSIPADFAARLGAASPLAYFAGAIVFAPVALAYAEAGSLFAGDGGAYLYAREVFGRRVAFTVAWSMWLTMVMTLAAAVAAIPAQIAEFLPGVAAPAIARPLVVALILAFGLVNAVDEKLGAGANGVLAVLKVLPLVALVTAGAWVAFGSAGAEAARPAPEVHGGLAAYGGVLLPVSFALSGFETCATPGALARRPKRDVPLSVLLSVFGVAALYGALQWVAVLLVPDLAHAERPLAEAARVVAGPLAARGMSIVGTLAMLGLAAAMAFAAPRVLVALAHDGHLPPSWGPRPGQPPRIASLLTAVSAVALVLPFDFHALVDISSVTAIVQYAATCAVILALRRKPHAAAKMEDAIHVPFGVPLAIGGLALLVLCLAQATLLELAISGVTMIAGEFVAYGYRQSLRAHGGPAKAGAAVPISSRTLR